MGPVADHQFVPYLHSNRPSMVISFTDGFEALKLHPMTKYDVALLSTRPDAIGCVNINTFESRAAADSAGQEQ